MLKRFLSYYKPYKKILILDLLAALTVGLLSIVYPIITRKMLNEFIPNRDYQMIIGFGGLLLLIYLLTFFLNYFITYKGHVMGVNMQADMRSDLFNHLQDLPFSFYDDNETGRIMTSMNEDLFDVAELAHHGPENIIISIITLITSFIYLTTINLPLSLIIFTCVPILIVTANKTRKKHLKARRKTRAARSEINGNLQTSISGIRITKAFNNKIREIKKFNVGNKKFVDSSIDSYRAMAVFGSTTSFITDLFNVVVLIAGGYFLYQGSISFADYSTFIVSTNMFLSPIMKLINFTEQLQEGYTGFEKFCQVMDKQIEKDREDAIEIKNVNGNIEFNNVIFEYEKDDVLNDISFKIEAGKCYALVGPSGGGKTTICHLIPHFYNIEKGQILIDGVDINQIKRNSLRDNIGIVQQDVYLFNSSIKDNILYGKQDASFEDVVAAAKAANIHDFIVSLPNGYDTVVGERGVKLSGGQKQRISIARVFLKNPAILILDEATSALDTASERLIQKALDDLTVGRTTIVVAHRLSTIINADEIAYIDNGRIIESGNHKDLLALNGAYSKLYNQQFE